MGRELVLSMDQRSLVAPSVEPDVDLRVYLNLLRRRYLFFIIPAVVVFAAICAVTFLLLPSVYQATGKILVVSQLIPSDLATSTVAASAAERINVIEQRLTTRDNLLGIAQKFDLYPERRGFLSPSEIVDWLREATKIQQVELEDMQKTQRAKPGTEAVAFSLSFDYYEPVVAARVANELIASILEQNIQARAGRAAETSKFFSQQVSKLEGQLAEKEKRIADYKRANEASSPETLNDRREQLTQLQTQIAEVDQLIALGTAGKDSVEAQAQLNGLNGRRQATQRQLQNNIDQRASLEVLFKKGYLAKPRLMDLDNRIAQLQGEIEEITASITIAQNKLSQNGGQPELLPKKRAELARQAAALEESISKTPEVESGLSALSRDYENLQTQYRLVKAKTTVAATGEQMEEDRQAERFEVIEQAVVPTEPASPDRPRILVGGAFASVVAGIGLVFLLELMDKSIRSSADLERLLHTRALATIPYVTTLRERQRKKWKLWAFLASFLFMFGIGLVLVHELYRPLDVLAQRLLELLSVYGWR